MKPIEVIEKYYEGYGDKYTVVLLYGEQVTEIDEENQLIFYGDGDEAPIDEIENDDIKVFEVEELDFPDDIGEFLKNVKSSKKSLENYNNVKKMLVFGRNEVYILIAEVLEDELTSLDYICNYCQSLGLFSFKLIKENKYAI